MGYQTLKGFRDFLPEQLVVRNKVIKILQEVFENFGFDPLVTPTLEYAEVLTGKYGEEADKLLYTFEDRGGRKVGLNYDLTVPLARVLSSYPNLPIPFKRYQIQPSYRAENTQRGRYRQFTQCDIDIIGANSPLADAEILAVIYFALTKLGFTNFSIYLNSRLVLFEIMKRSNIPEEKWLTVLQTVDKLDKLTLAELDEELDRKGLGLGLFSSNINPKLQEISTSWQQVDPYLQLVYNHALEMGVPSSHLKVKTSIVRGLDYYTGPIFETFIHEAQIGSVASGGRYDHLVEKLGGPNLSGVGTTLGLDRICDVIEEKNLWQSSQKTVTQALVTVFDKEYVQNSINAVVLLREKNIKTEIYTKSDTALDKQIRYADHKGIPYVIIIGPDEASNNTATVKNLATREQKTLALDQLPNEIISST